MRRPLGTAGGIICAVMIAAGIFAPWLARYPYAQIHPAASLQGPSAHYWLGTDELGRDLYSRVVYGARTDAIIAFAGIAIASVLGAVLGIVSGYLRGWLDLVLQRIVDIGLAVPVLLLVVLVAAVAGTGMTQIVVPLGVVFGIRTARIVRGSVMALAERPFIESAKAVGASRGRIMWRHIMPNVFPLIIVLATVQIGALVLTEATISFIGYGVPPPVPTWGQMLSGAGAQYMELNPFIAIWPGLAITLLVFGFNVFGDALRDAADPRLRGAR